MIRRSSIFLGKVFAGLLALCIIAGGLFFARLAAGPISIPALKSRIEQQLTQARDGRPVKVSRVELAWGAKSSLELRARDVVALDSHGAELTRSKDVVIGLRFLSLIVGRVSVTEARFNGVDVTLTTLKDGSSTLAFGPPGSQPDIVMPAPPANETLRQRVGRLLDGMRAALKPVGAGGKLNAVTITGARLTIIDEGTGGRWSGQDAAFDLKRGGSSLKMRASASLKGSKGPAPFVAEITTDTAFNAALISLTVKDARPAALGPFAPKGPMAGLSAPVTLALHAGIDRKKGVTLLDGDLALGRGVLDLGGGKLQVASGKISGRYDVASDTLVIRDVSINGSKTKLQGDARVLHASAILAAEPKEPALFRVSSPQISFEMPGAFSGPVAINKLTMTGSITPEAIIFDKFVGTVEAARLNLKGKLYWGDDGKGATRLGIQATGVIDGAMSAKSALRLWPLHLGEGARTWLGDALLDGRLYDATVFADITPADFARPEGLPNEKLSVKFKFDRAAVRYLEGMTPITSGYGDAELKANAFYLTLTRGAVADMSVTQGRVEIPRIYPKGALGTYGGKIEGDAKSMVTLLLQAPIELDKRLPFTLATITGRGVVDFAIQRPLRSDVPKDGLLFKVDGHLDNAGGVSKDGAFTISQWRMKVFGDEKRLTFAGPLALGASRAELSWSEQLRGNPVSSSTVNVKGRLDAADIMSLGFPVMEYAKGPVGVDARAMGNGTAPNSGTVMLDFRDAVLTLPKGFFVKPAGQGASVTFTLARQKDNTLMLNDIVASGPGISGNGVARLSSGGDLMEASTPRLTLAGVMDGKVNARRNQQGILDVFVTSSFLNISPFFAPDPQAQVIAAAQTSAVVPTPNTAPPRPGKLSPAFQIDARADRMRLRGDADLKAAHVIAGSDGFAMTKLSLDGADPGGKPFGLTILPTPGQAGTGKFAMKSEDAGFAVRALTGQTNVKGGTAEANGTWRFAVSPTATIHLKMKNFRLVQVPAMAQLLGSVASLTGMVDMLNGDGIQFGDLEAPMTMANNQVTLGECRAAGPAIGLTAKGGINLNDGNLDIDGVIVPSYGLNSMLGNLPILGGLIVSRKGEGVFGLTYSLNGPADKPRVGVNPLSAFTPGIFRRIFEPLQKAPKEKAG